MPMNIALFGYGKMGKTVEKIAVNRHHKIVAIVDKDFSKGDITDADVAIDFSIPDVAYDNITTAIKNNVAVVSGTTGWLSKYNEVVSYCKEQNGAFIYASNFSLGVNIFFELNKILAEMMRKFDDYKLSMEETHHSQKLDAPSGTAITLAEDIIKVMDYQKWDLNVTNDPKTIPILSIRKNEVPGTHKITYQSDVDKIEIIHTAKNRHGFALGAIIAAEWLNGKKGVFSMKDVMGL